MPGEERHQFLACVAGGAGHADPNLFWINMHV
jgi:hypothetical protein